MEKNGLTEAEIEQRRNAGMGRATHSAYAYQERGETALKQTARGRLAELKEQVVDRAGVLDLMQENAVKAVMMVELLVSYIGGQKMNGIPLDQIPALRVLPGYMNTAQRALKDLISQLPSGEDVIDAEKILQDIKKVREHDNEESETNG